MGLRIAIDTGGTFTDVVAIDEADGRRYALKTPSTPADPSIGLLDGVRKAAEAASQEEGAIARLLHGSTTATNAVLQHQFDGLGLIVTEGFRHVIEIARQSVPDGYGNSFFWVKPPRLVPLHLVRGVKGRMTHGGQELEALDEEGLLEAAGDLAARGVTCIASASCTPTPTTCTSVAWATSSPCTIPTSSSRCPRSCCPSTGSTSAR